VSYKGNVPALTDVIAGHLSSMFTTLPAALEQATSGTIRMLAVSSEARDPRLPNIPTIGESGFPGFRAVSWHGLMAPARTPKPVIDRIAAELARTLHDANVTDRLVALGVTPIGNSSSEFAAMIAADMPLWAEAVKIAGVEMR
jgi:tripartite-type tricarboxylate transporter receptor subunit TctC